MEKVSGKRFRAWAFVFVAFLAMTFASIFLFSDSRRMVAAKQYEQRVAEAFLYCDSLFDENSAVFDEVTDADLKDCVERLDVMGNSEDAWLREYVAAAENYRVFAAKTEGYFDGEVVRSAFSEGDLRDVEMLFEGLAEAYRPRAQEKLDVLRSEYEAMRTAREAVSGLFSGASVRGDVNRAWYSDTKAKVDALKQEDLKEEFKEPLAEVLQAVEKAEQIARERAEAARRAEEERQRKIAESWRRLDISPYYINQHAAGLDNGCEAAALLMALKYKGYGRGFDFRSFALGMPTSDNPNSGFYLSMTDLEPRDEAHWIAPAPLAAYGAAASGAAVSNASGYSLDQLDQEVANGNPVVVYLTYGLRAPKEYKNGVPRNLHVLVLSGFNSYTGEQVLYDPWPAGYGASVTVSKATVASLYAASGYRAVVVR